MRAVDPAAWQSGKTCDSAYHSARARAEIEAAYRAGEAQAAAAHLALSALHLERASLAPSAAAAAEVAWMRRCAPLHRARATP